MANYKTINVPAGKTHNIALKSGDELTNTLIDVTKKGASVSLRAHGNNWAIRNVGIKGAIDVERPSKIFAPSVSKGGKAVVENFYLGDGAKMGIGPSRIGGTWVNASGPHEGDLILRNVHIGRWADNGVYGSGPAKQHGARAGSVKVENSYAKNANIAGFRIGGHGSYVKNSTIVCDGDLAPVAMPGRKNGRGVWCKDVGTLRVENCDFVMTGPHASYAVQATDGASAEVIDCRINGNKLGGKIATKKGTTFGTASPDPPKGVPMTAEEAASGTISDWTKPTIEDLISDDEPNRLQFDSRGADDTIYYSVIADGAEPGPNANLSDDTDYLLDHELGTQFGGQAAGYMDDWDYSGRIHALEVDDRFTIRLNGERVDASALIDYYDAETSVPVPGDHTDDDDGVGDDGDESEPESDETDETAGRSTVQAIERIDLSERDISEIVIYGDRGD